jgi:hypothetical protein
MTLDGTHTTLDGGHTTLDDAHMTLICALLTVKMGNFDKYLIFNILIKAS